MTERASSRRNQRTRHASCFPPMREMKCSFAHQREMKKRHKSPPGGENSGDVTLGRLPCCGAVLRDQQHFAFWDDPRHGGHHPEPLRSVTPCQNIQKLFVMFLLYNPLFDNMNAPLVYTRLFSPPNPNSTSHMADFRAKKLCRYRAEQPRLALPPLPSSRRRVTRVGVWARRHLC